MIPNLRAVAGPRQAQGISRDSPYGDGAHAVSSVDPILCETDVPARALTPMRLADDVRSIVMRVQVVGSAVEVDVELVHVQISQSRLSLTV